MKRTGRDHDGRVIILPPTTAEEHIVVQRQSKARTTLLQSIPDDHVADFYYMDDARDIWNAVKVRVQKILSQLNQLKAKPDAKDINLKFLRALPSSSSQMSKVTIPFLQANLHDQAILHLLVPPVLAKRCHMDIVQIILHLLPTQFHQTLRLGLTDLIEKLDLEEMDLKWQMAMLSVRVHKFEQKARRKIDFDKKESARANGGNDKQRYFSFKIKEIGNKEEDSKALITVDTLVDWTNHDRESDGVIAAKEFGMIAGCDSEDAIKEGAAKENELGWDDSAFSVFTTNSEDVEGRPIFHRFAKTDSMKVVPLPLTGDYTSLSDHTDLDESQMSYGTKFSTSCDPKYVPNDFVSCDDSDKSLEVNTNDFAISDSSVKSSEHKPTDFTSCASTSSVSTSVNEAETESNVGTPFKEPIIVQDLPSFTCNSFDKNEHTSRTSCNKNGYFNKKACHFRKNASSVSKLCFVCGSGTHLIKDCDYYEQQMTNKTIGIGVGLVYNWNKVNYQNQFVPQAVLLRTGKVKPVPTGKPKVTPVPTGKPKVTPVPTGKPKVTSVPTGKPKVTSVPTGKPQENPFSTTADEGIFYSGCSRIMTGNKESLDDFQAFQGGKVTFGGGEGRITGKRTIRTPTLVFENVYYVKELQQFNLFSIS
nr:ribonuclease H-like domain-containing protein [Tanacetum cinerariifolium]